MADERGGASHVELVAPTVAAAALGGLCPRCGARTLFAGLTRFADRCRACGLDLSLFNVGDGPTAFLTFIMGCVLVGIAIALELTAEPPLWAIALILLPIGLAGVIACLRVSKAALVALEYRHAAREGRIAEQRP